MMIHTVFDNIGGAILVSLFGTLLLLETNFELRNRLQNRWRRAIINFIVSIPSFSLLRLLLIPLMVWLATESKNLNFGLSYHYPSPYWLKIIVSFLLLDYSNYVWHILLHKIPFLWRFHLVHHSDVDLDITTAFRFHFGELIGSVFFRGAVVFLLGASPMLVLVYEIAFEGTNQFQHSNWKLPIQLEKVFNKILVTPRMHGIHHSTIKEEADSNFSIIFSFWDRLHKTVRLNIPQKSIKIGVPAYSNAKELSIIYLWKLPFTKIRKWEKSHLKREKPNKFSEKI